MTLLTAHIESIGFWTNGLPSWDAARDFVATGTLPEGAPAKPSPQLLPPNERRRAPESVAVALEVALSACQAAGRDPASLPSVFTSTHGDLSITDYVCTTLAAEPTAMSPTKFHNSVHNAAAGYWTIGAGCVEAATAISAYDGSFAEGLLEALAQLAAGAEAVLLVGYDTGATGPLRSVHDCTGLLGGALLLSREGQGPRISVAYADGDARRRRPTRPPRRRQCHRLDAAAVRRAGLGRRPRGAARRPAGSRAGRGHHASERQP